MNREVQSNCNVGVEAAVEALLASTRATYDGLDSLYYNASAEQPIKPGTEVAEALFERILSVNFRKIVFGCE